MYLFRDSRFRTTKLYIKICLTCNFKVMIWSNLNIFLLTHKTNKSLKNFLKRLNCLALFCGKFWFKIELDIPDILQIFKFLNINSLFLAFFFAPDDVLYTMGWSRSEPEERIVLLVAHWKEKALYFTSKAITKLATRQPNTR